MSAGHLFDTTTETGYGRFWQNSLQAMNSDLTEHSMSISYDRSSKKITILNSSALSKAELNKIFADKVYDRWKPEVLDSTDALGNRIARLVPDIKNIIITESQLFSRSFGSRLSPSLRPSKLLRPHIPSYTERSSLIQDKFPYASRRYQTLPIPSSLPREESIPPFSQEEIAEVQTAISCGVKDALTAIMTNEKTALTGVWYPTDLDRFLKESGEVMPEDYWTGHADTELFNKTGRFTFELKEGKPASDAIEALLAGPSVLDCGNATQLAYYKTLLGMLGQDKFNKLFSGEIFKLKITQKGITDYQSPISLFADYSEASKTQARGSLGNRPLSIGEECHFKGIRFYGNKHPAGFGGGWNVVYVGNSTADEQLFIAHGFTKPMTEREIYRLLVEAYNLDRTLQDELFIEVAKDPSLYDKSVNRFLRTQYTIPLTNSDTAVDGFLVGSCRGLRAEPILLAKKRPVDLALKLSLLEASIAASDI